MFFSAKKKGVADLNGFALIEGGQKRSEWTQVMAIPQKFERFHNNVPPTFSKLNTGNNVSLGEKKSIGSYFNSTRQQRSTTRGRESESSLASGIEILCESPPVEANRWQVDADNNHLTRKMARSKCLVCDGLRFQSINMSFSNGKMKYIWVFWGEKRLIETIS